MFVDKVNVTLMAGDGGDGITSFRHEKFQKLGGPDGGDGGDGGDIILQASRNQNTLATYRYKKLLKAQPGTNGQKNKRHGRNGQDLLAEVPVGTVVLLESGEVLADFIHDGQTETLARGGKGGYGNAHFVSSVRQAPRVAEKGEQGEIKKATFELKMIADVGLIGLPNAGKSTLLSVISNAKPEIADYPFTTLTPNLGVVDIDQETFLFADIPGLIAGASHGKGLGDEFLRHIERTAVLIHLIDAYSENIVEDYKTIVAELRDYVIDLSQKPQVVAITKIEGLAKKDLTKKVNLLKRVTGKKQPVITISSLSGEGLKEMLRLVRRQVEANRLAEAKDQASSTIPIIGLREDDNSWEVKKTDHGFEVIGKKLERFANRTKPGNPDGEARLRDILKKNGVIKELERHGIEPGQKISIGSPRIIEIDY